MRSTKFIVTALAALLVATPVMSERRYDDNNRHDNYNRHQNHNYQRYNDNGYHSKYSNRDHNWVVPVLIGGAIIYGISQANRQSAYVEPVPVVPQPITIRPEYVEKQLWDPDCNCYRRVFVQIN